MRPHLIHVFTFIQLAMAMQSLPTTSHECIDSQAAVEFAENLLVDDGFSNFLERKDLRIHKKVVFKAFVDACRCNHIEAIKIFLNSGQVNPFHDHSKALVAASQNGSLEAVQLLLDDGRVLLRVCKSLPLVKAAEHGHAEIVKLLLQADQRSVFKPQDSHDSPHRALTVAAENGHLEVVQCLLADQRINPAYLRNKPLTAAAATGQLQIVNLLLSLPSVTLAGQFDSALQLAARNRHSAVVKVLLGTGACNIMVALQEAILADNRDLVVDLLLLNADVNQLLPNGISALRMAHNFRRFDIITLMKIFPLLVFKSGNLLNDDVVDLIAMELLR